MRLCTADGTFIDQPDAAQIEQQIRSLPGGADSFAILETDQMTYVQAAGGGAEPFTLEYQAGSVDAHYRAADDVPIDIVVQVFQAYAVGRDWQSLVQWQQQDLAVASKPSPRVIASVVSLLVLAGVVAYWWYR